MQLTISARFIRTVFTDLDKARYWFERAASLGDGDAACALGQMYESEKGTSTDSVKALKWYRMAADLGNSPACLILASAYENGGLGLPVDHEAAKEYSAKHQRSSVAEQAELEEDYPELRDMLHRKPRAPDPS